MDSLYIKGGRPLMGDVIISGAKNAVLPILAASILAEEPLSIKNVPHLHDVTTMIELLGRLGLGISLQEDAGILVDASCMQDFTVPYELVRTMRASILVLGPMLARHGKARVSLPGGCAIGTRPVNIHLKGLEAMGATVHVDAGYIEASVKGRLKGATIYCESVTVTGTENLMMAGCLAEGTTVIENAALEPEVVDLAICLNKMGARIQGAGTSTIVIEGVSALKGCEHHVIADRIEAGTYLAATAVTRGWVKLKAIDATLLTSTLAKFREAGCAIDVEKNTISLDARNCVLSPMNIKTAPYPAVPTDMQAQLMVLNCLANGTSSITETIFENRFMHVSELLRMGADIRVEGNTAICCGVDQLHGAQVMATDLRASASLVLAGLAAKGETHIRRIYHIDRGYACIEEKLRMLGADVQRCIEG
jgi:UDP-N-acetylglucosamine 1-carboxyvinyltransferase